MWDTVDHKFRNWLVSRYPVQSEVLLTHKRIYIFPTLAGLAFICVALLVLMLAINYQNNLAYAICFTLTSLFITAIMHTYANLSGLRIRIQTPTPVFVGDELRYRFEVLSSRSLTQLQFGFRGQEQVTYDLERDKPLLVYVPASSQVRGWQAPALLRISSVYPLGIFRCWTWLRFEEPALIYPRPVAGGELGQLNRPVGGDGAEGHVGEEDFQELKSYQPGAPLSRVAWKVYAKGYGLHVKSYQGEEAQERWLSWHLWPQLDTEAKLSRLTYWAVTLNERQTPFGLVLPNVTMEPAVGDDHLREVLKHLALYDEGALL